MVKPFSKFFLTALLGFVFPSVVSAQLDHQVTLQTFPGGIGRDSNGDVFDGSFQFEIGVFASGFTPTELNRDQWLANWTALNSIAVGGDPGPAAWVPGGSNGGEASQSYQVAPGQNNAPFAIGTPIYVWGYNTRTAATNEWVLIRNAYASADPVWEIPQFVGLFSGGLTSWVVDGQDMSDVNDRDVAFANTGLVAADPSADPFIQTTQVTLAAGNSTPVAVDDPYPSVVADTLFSVSAPGLLGNDTDADLDDLDVAAVNDSGLSGSVSVTNATGAFDYDPRGVPAFVALDATETATDTFTYTVTDGAETSNAATVTFTVTGVNDAPTANDDSGYTVAKDSTLTVTLGDTPVLANDTDPDTSDTLTVSASDAASAEGGTVSVNANGTFAYTPPATGTIANLGAGQSQNDTFSYTVSDGDATDTATVTISVTGLNDNPVATDDPGTPGAYATDEDTALNVNAANGLLANDTDVNPGATLEVTTPNVTSALGAAVTIAADGSFTYDPTGVASIQDLTTGDTPNDTFDYTIIDNQTGSDSATATVVLSGVNANPVAVADSGFGLEKDETTSGFVLTNDTDEEPGTLTVNSFDATSVEGATVTVNTTTGEFTYDPSTSVSLQALASGGTQADSFTYTVIDSDGGVSAAGTVSLLVSGANTPPVATDDTGTIDENSVLNAPADALLLNDTDAETPGSLNTVAATLTTANGASVTVGTDGSYTYDPTGSATLNALDPGDSLGDTFTYTVTDGIDTDTGTVTITVTGVNDNPVAGDDTATTDEDTAFNGSAPGILANDTDADDEDGASGIALTASVATSQPATGGGTYSVAVDGSWSFNPGADFHTLPVGSDGTATFTYTVNDNGGGSDTATVTITVTGLNDNPVAVDDAYATDADLVLTVAAASGVISGTGTDSDPDLGDTISVDSFDSLSVEGAAIAVTAATGAFTYDGRTVNSIIALPAAATLVDTFTYTLGDGNAGSDTATVSITVTGVNDPPAFTSSEVTTVAEDSPYTHNITTSDPDTGASITITDTTAPAWLSFTDNTDGTASLTGTPANADVGTHSIVLTASDGTDSVQQTFDLVVTPVNDPPVLTVPGPLAVDEDASGGLVINGGNAISVADPDSGAADIEVSLSTTSSATGVLTLGSSAGLTLVSGSFVGSAEMTFRGPLATVNSALNVVRYEPVTDFSGADTITVTVDDLGNTGGGSLTDSETIAITVNPVNDAPVLTLPLDQETESNQALTISAGNSNLISIADVDAGGGDLRLELAIDNSATLSLATTVGLTFQDGTADNSDDIHVTGTLASINAALDGLVIDPPTDFGGDLDLTISISDQGNTGSGGALTDGGTLTIFVEPFDFPSPIPDPGFNTQDSFLTGLFIQQVEVEVLADVNGLRLLVRNIPNTARLMNATGTTGGVPYIDFHSAIAAGTTLTFTLEYDSDVFPMDGSGIVIEVEPILVAPPADLADGSINPTVKGTLADGSVVIEFDSVPGEEYFIQWSGDGTNFTTIFPRIRAGGTKVIWVDRGPPATPSHPSMSGARFYQVLLAP